VSPIPKGEDEKKENKQSEAKQSDDYFDQIDDDFPFENEHTPNTRTFWRPGARTALWACSLFATQHVYTAAQESYTNNIMKELDPQGRLFASVTHRDSRPEIVTHGKDLSAVLTTDTINCLHRALLFDDRVKNFDPQNGKHGIHVRKFQSPHQHDQTFGAKAREAMEMSRLVAASFTALIFTDVRSVTRIFRSEEHSKRFPDEK
jgi:hypothetical protein